MKSLYTTITTACAPAHLTRLPCTRGETVTALPVTCHLPPPPPSPLVAPPWSTRPAFSSWWRWWLVKVEALLGQLLAACARRMDVMIFRWWRFCRVLTHALIIDAICLLLSLPDPPGVGGGECWGTAEVMDRPAEEQDQAGLLQVLVLSMVRLS